MRAETLMPSVVAVLLLLALQASVDPLTRTIKGSNPAVGDETEAAIGDLILAAFERTEAEYARLKQDVRISDSGKTLPKGMLLEAGNEVGTVQKLFCK